VSAVLDEPRPVVRPMRSGDLSDVARIERAAYPFPWSESIFRDCLRVGYCCWVVDRARVVAGHAVMSAVAGESHVLNLCVHPAVQSRGLGRFMLEHLIGLARERQARTMYLEVRPSNRHARELYRSAGFIQIGRRRDYYPDRRGREDALVLGLALNDHGG